MARAGNGAPTGSQPDQTDPADLISWPRPANAAAPDRRTAPLGLAFFKSAHLTDYSLLSAAGVIVALPIVVLYVFLQRRFISGMLNGIADR